MLEDPGENPFLARFYQDMARYALPTQLFFLFQRVRMLEPLAQSDLFARATVADFLLDKDPLFARLTLSGDELALYEKLFAALRPRAPQPDLVVYLQAQPAVLDAGDVLFFHCKTLHAATRNHTEQTKYSVVFTFRGADNPPRAESRSAESPELLIHS